MKISAPGCATSSPIWASQLEPIDNLFFISSRKLLERARAVFDEYERETGTPLEGTPELMVEAIANGNIFARANNIGFISSMFDVAQSLERCLAF
jgi:hypothetical protein